MGNIIGHPDQVTAERLTDLLRRQGALPRGVVIGAAAGEGKTTFASRVWRLEGPLLRRYYQGLLAGESVVTPGMTAGTITGCR